MTSKNRELAASGRTHRMLEYAEERARRGDDVIVLAVSHTFTQSLLHRFVRMFGLNERRPAADCKVTLPGGGSVKFEVADWRLDVREGRIDGVHPSCTVLIDHHSAECLLPQWLVEQVHRFDAGNGKNDELPQHVQDAMYPNATVKVPSKGTTGLAVMWRNAALTAQLKLTELAHVLEEFWQRIADKRGIDTMICADIRHYLDQCEAVILKQADSKALDKIEAEIGRRIEERTTQAK